MIRVIKRYESRKLYDTEESRYVSLEDIAQWVREDQEVRVIDNATSADVSAQVLTQIILDEGKKGTSFLPTELLHELVRAGEKALSSGVEQFQGKMGRIVQSSIDRLAPVRRAREEMGQLRDRLSQLEQALDNLDDNEDAATAPAQAGEDIAAAEKPAPRRRRAATPKTATLKTAEESVKKPARRTKAATTKSAATKKATTAKSAATKKATAKSAAAKTATAKTATAKTATAKTATAKSAAAKTAAAKTTAAKTKTVKKTARVAASKPASAGS